MLAFLAAATLATRANVPLEPQMTDALQNARRTLYQGNRGRALATLDSLVFNEGLTVSVEAPGALDPAVEEGFDAWNSALAEPTFRMKPVGSPADVVVRFVPSLDAEGADVQGMVQATRQLSWSDRDHTFRLRAVVFVRDRVEGRPIHRDEVVNVVAHEAGHILGLADVNREDRLMGPMVVNRLHLAPTEDEVEAVRDYRASVRRSYPKG